MLLSLTAFKAASTAEATKNGNQNKDDKVQFFV